MNKYYDEDYLLLVKNDLLLKINEEIIISLNAYIIDFNLITRSPSVRYRTSNFYSSFIESFVDLLINKIKINREFCKSYQTEITYLADEHITNLKIFYNLNIEGIKIFENFVKVLINEFKRIIFLNYLKINKHLKTINIKKLEIVHLIVANQLMINIKYIEVPNNLKSFIKRFDNIKVIEKDELFNSYSLTIDESQKIKLINKQFIDLKLLYIDKNYFMTTSVLKNILINNNIDNQIIIRLPLFLYSNSLIFKSKYHGHYKLYYEFSKYFDNLIDMLSNLGNNENITLIISDIMTYNDYLLWRKKIRSLSENKIKIGVVLEDFDFFEYNDFNEFNLIERIKTFDLVIIQIDHLLMNQLGRIDFEIESYINEIHEDLKQFKNYLLELKITPVIYSKNLKNEQLLEKLMKMGFKNYIFSYENIGNVNNSYTKYMSRRGKYTKKSL